MKVIDYQDYIINFFLHLFKKESHSPFLTTWVYPVIGRHGGLMVSGLVSGLSSLGLSPGRDIALCKTLYSHSASLHPGV